MKKITVLFILLLIAGTNSFSQKKSGVIFSEHEAITKTQELWNAFVEGDEATYRSFFADSALIIRNGNSWPSANAQIGKGLSDFSKNYENLKVQDQKPAFPDAMEYKEGGTWVQDWLLMTGVHKETGIVVDLPLHNIYSFDDDGKIKIMIMYFDDDVFEEIGNSTETRENGTVYINHPYIVKVRKAVNAFVARDIETMAGYFSPKAVITFSAMKPGESMSVDEYKKYMADRYFKDELKYKMEQIGYPDCVHYEKSDQYVVYSWWNLIVQKDGKKYEIPLMLSHDFNDDGEVVRMHVYASDNHFDFLD